MMVEHFREKLLAMEGGTYLKVEGNAEPFVNPTEDTIRGQLKGLRSTGPSLLALVRPDGSHLLAVGNARGCVIDGYVVKPEGKTHIQLGRPHWKEPGLFMSTTGAPLLVNSTDIWSVSEALALFVAFAKTGSIRPDCIKPTFGPSVPLEK